jgi:hypothetical protein
MNLIYAHHAHKRTVTASDRGRQRRQSEWLIHGTRTIFLFKQSQGRFASGAPLHLLTSINVSQYGSLPRSQTSNSNLPHMMLALPSYMHVSSRRLTPSIRNVTHMPKRFLVNAANPSRFIPSCVSQGPKGPLWRRKETVYAKLCSISSRKARRHIRNKASCGLLNVLQSRSVTIIAFGHTAASRPRAWPVRLLALCAVYLSLTPASF